MRFLKTESLFYACICIDIVIESIHTYWAPAVYSSVLSTGDAAANQIVPALNELAFWQEEAAKNHENVVPVM